MKKFADFTSRIKSNEQALKGVNAIADFGTKYKKYGVAPQVVTILAGIKTDRAKLNDTASVAAIDKATVELQKAE
jgi:aminopeptidase N